MSSCGTTYKLSVYNNKCIGDCDTGFYLFYSYHSFLDEYYKASAKCLKCKWAEKNHIFTGQGPCDPTSILHCL